MKRMLAFVAMIAVAVGTFGCGGGSENEMPSEDQVNKAITDMYGDTEKAAEQGAEAAEDALESVSGDGS